jgi:mono/diheme cytochrome c family protein
MKRTGQGVRRAAAGVALAASLLAAGGCGRGGTAGAGEDPSRALYRRHCAACHGPDGAGGQVGQVNVPSLKEGRVVEYTDQQLFEQIYHGRGAMPPFKYTLTDEQISTLARFVREDIQGRR